MTQTLEFEFCATGPGGGVDPTCSPQRATGSGSWPPEVRRRLRALQSRLSRAQTVEAKAQVVLQINALIAAQNGQQNAPAQAPAPTPAATQAAQALSARDMLLAQAAQVEIVKTDNFAAVPAHNRWVLSDGLRTGKYYFKTPSGRTFRLKYEFGGLSFTDNTHSYETTGQGEAHHVFAEVTKATIALATKTRIPKLSFTADKSSKGRVRLYRRLATSLAALVPGAKVTETESAAFYYQKYDVVLRDAIPGVTFAFCPTGPGGGVDPTCSPANAGTGYKYQNVTQLRVNQWPEADRRALRALQSRLSRAVGEEAKDAVRRQIIALRNRVNAVHDALRSPINQPAAVAQAAAAHQAAQAAQSNVDKESIDRQLRMLEAPQSHERIAPEFQRRVNQILKANGVTDEDKAAAAKTAAILEDVMQNLYPGLDADSYGETLAQVTGLDDVAAEALAGSATPMVHVKAGNALGRDYISINVSHGGMLLHRMIRYDYDGDIVVKNNLFTLPKDVQKDGIGVRIFSNQVANLTNSKATYIATDAARGGDLVGYKVWPKFGYDTDYLNTSTAPPGVAQQAYTRDDGRWIGAMQATLSTKEGRDWWNKSGDSINLKFYLDDEKFVSQSVLREYRAARWAKVKQAAGVALSLAFCPTGPGGGVDPTCSPANAGTGQVALKKATGSKNWPTEARNKLRALQSRLSRAKTPEAKQLVVQQINALIDAQNGAPAAPASAPAPAPATAQQQSQALAVVDSKVSVELQNQGLRVFNSLNADQKSTLRFYTQSGYESINGYLRKNEGIGSEPSYAISATHAKDSVKAMDVATRKDKTDRDYVMTRAVGPNTQKKWVEGYVHTEHGYLSMSARTPISNSPMGSGWDKVNRCIITVPKGTPGIYAGVFSSHKSENEFIATRGLKLRVTHRRDGVSREEARAALLPNKTDWKNSLKKEKYNLIYMTVEQ